MWNLKLLYVVVVCAGVSNSSLTPAPAASHTLAGATVTKTGGGGKGGADAVSLNYHVFASTVLWAYFMQFIDH